MRIMLDRQVMWLDFNFEVSRLFHIIQKQPTEVFYTEATTGGVL